MQYEKIDVSSKPFAIASHSSWIFVAFRNGCYNVLYTDFFFTLWEQTCRFFVYPNFVLTSHRLNYLRVSKGVKMLRVNLNA